MGEVWITKQKHPTPTELNNTIVRLTVRTECWFITSSRYFPKKHDTISPAPPQNSADRKLGGQIYYNIEPPSIQHWTKLFLMLYNVDVRLCFFFFALHSVLYFPLQSVLLPVWFSDRWKNKIYRWVKESPNSRPVGAANENNIQEPWPPPPHAKRQPVDLWWIKNHNQ